MATRRLVHCARIVTGQPGRGTSETAVLTVIPPVLELERMCGRKSEHLCLALQILKLVSHGTRVQWALRDSRSVN